MFSFLLCLYIIEIQILFFCLLKIGDRVHVLSYSVPHAYNKEISMHIAQYKSLRKLSCIQRFPLE